ncbi:hypothetical protein BSKO_10888 [Bryopsis sp. KO-2023]|nr:hypothetical protein BSKO_10888 [Bryopsis sp. KO-2023]
MGFLHAGKRSIGVFSRLLTTPARGNSFVLCRSLSAGPSVDLNSASYIVWGAGTDVGKTLFSAGLAYSAAVRKERLLYVKPVQTGFPESCDSKTVASGCGGGVTYGPHASHFSNATPISNREPVQCHTLYAWEKPASPHLAEKADDRELASDEVIVKETAKFLALATPDHGLALVETAGGVCSPFPSGTLQCDALRPLRLPGILVGDHKLGGISATISAYESLLLRGFDVVAVALTVDPNLDNAEFLSHNFRKHVHWIGGERPVLTVLPALPKSSEDPEKHQLEFLKWLETARPTLDEFSENLKNMYAHRCKKLRYSVYEAKETLWWPFTQHKNVEKEDMAVIDSRWGDHLSIVKPLAFKQWKTEPQFDACASWWTQGLGSHVQPEMARAIAYATGRYGHVIFPENVHDAVLQCSQKLVSTIGRPWAYRAFYSDDGSTAVEVGIKMGLRLYLAHNRQSIRKGDKMQIFGFGNSYHGDTLGAMDATPESVFNKTQTPWYKSQGVFLTPPNLLFRKGKWYLSIPEDWEDSVITDIPGINMKRRRVNLTDAGEGREKYFKKLYSKLIEKTIDDFNQEPSGEGGKCHVASMLMEPVVQGAGGMYLVDPVFQRQAVKASGKKDICQARGIPVILDEVFTGFWRLGAMSGAELLGVHPDIACVAKLLTGGYVPMSVTLTGKAAFKAFWGQHKRNALLHGHSYTAHPIGCVAACTAMDIMNDPKFNPNLILNQTSEEGPSKESPSVQVSETSQSSNESVTAKEPVPVDHPLPSSIPSLNRKLVSGALVTLWDDDLVIELSKHKKVEGVVAIGTLFALTLKLDENDEGGYSSGRAKEVTRRLRKRGIYTRPLGDVVYLMAGVTTPKEECTKLLTVLKQELDVDTDEDKLD